MNWTIKLMNYSKIYAFIHSYAMNLKGFIDETITSNSEFENSWTALYLQQFAMVIKSVIIYNIYLIIWKFY